MSGELAAFIQRTVGESLNGISWWLPSSPFRLCPWGISKDACKVLAPSGGEGWLCESDLKEIPVHVADLLCSERSQEVICQMDGVKIYLSAIKEMTADVAAIFRQVQPGNKPGFLALNSICLGDLSGDAVRHLAKFPGKLSLKDFEGDASELINAVKAMLSEKSYIEPGPEDFYDL